MSFKAIVKVIANLEAASIPLASQFIPKNIDHLRNKIDEFLDQGTVVGILVNLEDRTVEIRRLNQAPVVLQDNDVLTVPDLLPGWQVLVSELWPPVFE